MKKLLLAGFAAATVVVAAPAVSADLPAKAAGPAMVRSASACAQFGGGYIGVVGGSTYYDHKFNDLDNFGYVVVDIDNFGGFSNTDFGWHVGAGGGWNWQRGCTVFGVHADWSWTNAKTSSFHTDLDPDVNITMTSRMKWFATARTRTGIVVDNLLLYVTGGLAVAQFDRSNFYNDDGDTLLVGTNRTRIGWVAGVGTEWQISPNWTLGGEFLYMGFEKQDVTFTCTGAICDTEGQPFRYRFNDAAWISRVSLNYRWGGRGW
jgi:outer membrane immunogenic protein